MHAALVTAFDRPPRYAEVDEPTASAEHEEVVDLVAAALHPRVRSQAAGTHYTSDQELPLIPGIDGVGRRSDGSLVYFVLPDTRFGSLAERVAIDRRRSIPVPHGADPIAIAAAMNPAMSSWLALRRRARLEPGQSVLVLGATGSAGQLAVQVAQQLGAGRVVAAGRDQHALDALLERGADETVSLAGALDEASARVGEAAADVDVVVDYLYGAIAQAVIPAVLMRRTDRSARLDWVQVGAVTGPEISIASALLRGANFALMGSGQGSVSTHDILSELVPLMASIHEGAFSLATDVRRLPDVEDVWNGSAVSQQRIVFAID